MSSLRGFEVVLTLKEREKGRKCSPGSHQFHLPKDFDGILDSRSISRGKRIGPLHLSVHIFFLDFIYLFMRDTERERKRQKHKQRDKQAPCREPDVGPDPRSPGSSPGLKVVLNRWATRAAPVHISWGFPWSTSGLHSTWFCSTCILGKPHLLHIFPYFQQKFSQLFTELGSLVCSGFSPLSVKTSNFWVAVLAPCYSIETEAQKT